MFAYGSDGVLEALVVGARGGPGAACCGPREFVVPAGLPPRRPTPRPPRAVADEAGANRIVEDILDGRFVVLLAVDHPRGEALREQGAAASVASVVFPGVVALVPLGRLREILRPAVDDRVVMGSHQAVDVQAELEADEGTAEEPHEQDPVEHVQEERRLVDAVRRDVEVAVRQVGAKDASHSSTLRPRRLPDCRRRCSSPVPTRLRAPRRVSDTRRGPQGHGATRRGVR
jgi:hypothetical protein